MRTLPASDYAGAAVHELERRSIFAREWMCLGSAAPVAEPGSYLADVVAGWPILVVRDAAGELRAFHNVCRHRAGPLTDEGTGTCRSLVCRYHGWTYDLDGRLRSARGSEIDPAELADVGLFDVRAEVWRGLLFVHLGGWTGDRSGTGTEGHGDAAIIDGASADDDADVPSVETWLGPDLVAQCAGFPLESWRPVERLVHPIDANWKTYGDNYLEGYHIPFVHPTLARAIDTGSYTVEVGDGWARHRADPRDGSVATGAWLWHWPNLALNLYEHGMSVERWWPTGPSSCLLVLDFCFADTAGEAMLRNRLDIDASARICEEDKAICEAVQRNLEAGTYHSGLLSPRHEAGVADFHRRVLQARGTDAATSVEG